ncbi:1695_t:CDS:10, partial [Gigaspora rosea]
YIEAAQDVKVLLEDVKTITLYRGKLTAGRRNNPIEQMSCVGGDACHMYTPDVIQCTNTGSDGLDVNWRCNAELPDYLKFGPVGIKIYDAIKEYAGNEHELDLFGTYPILDKKIFSKHNTIDIYSIQSSSLMSDSGKFGQVDYPYPDDPYILHGSCGLEYTLYYKDNWRNDRSHQRFEEDEYFRYNDWYNNRHKFFDFSMIYKIVWISLVIFILYKIYSSFTGRRNFRPNNNNNQNFWPGGGGGGFYPRHDSFDQYSSQSRGGIGQNFWTGLGLGGIAGYFIGRNNSSQRPRPGTTVFTSPSSSSRSSSSSSNMTNAQGFGNTRRR